MTRDGKALAASAMACAIFLGSCGGGDSSADGSGSHAAVADAVNASRAAGSVRFTLESGSEEIAEGVVDLDLGSAKFRGGRMLLGPVGFSEVEDTTMIDLLLVGEIEYVDVRPVAEYADEPLPQGVHWIASAAGTGSNSGSFGYAVMEAFESLELAMQVESLSADEISGPVMSPGVVAYFRADFDPETVPEDTRWILFLGATAIEVGVDDEGLIRHVRWVHEPSDAVTTTEASQQFMDLSLSDYGVAVDVQEPPANEVVDFDEWYWVPEVQIGLRDELEFFQDDFEATRDYQAILRQGAADASLSTVEGVATEFLDISAHAPMPDVLVLASGLGESGVCYWIRHRGSTDSIEYASSRTVECDAAADPGDWSRTAWS
ncbi:MAG: hypothetical protein ACT4OX_17275 [Actinomycetota bacterium]